MKYLGMVIAICIAAAAGAQQPAPASAVAAPSSTPARAPAQAPPAAPGLDAGTVKNGEFESTGFKFHYLLPRGWQALDDAKRLAANQQLQYQYAHPVHNPNMPSSKKQSPLQKKTDATGANTPKTVPQRAKMAAIPNNFSLMVASPSGVDSVDSAVLPRINIWANHRIPSIDTAKQRAQVLETLGQVVVPTAVVKVAGRDFARVEVLHAGGGPYHSLWVTAAGDYLIGFDVRATSDVEMQALLETLRSVRFD